MIPISVKIQYQVYSMAHKKRNGNVDAITGISV